MSACVWHVRGTICITRATDYFFVETTATVCSRLLKDRLDIDKKKKTSKCLLLYNLYDPYTVIYFSAVHPVVGRGGGVRLQGRVEKQNHIYIYTNIIGAQKVDICLNAAVVVVRHYEHLYLYNIISYNQVPTTPGHKTMLVII